MDAIMNSVEDMVSEIMRWLPLLLGALIILLVAYIVAKVVGRLVASGLSKVGFDKFLSRGLGGSYIEKIVQVPSRTVGSIVFWLLWLGGISVAVTVLGIPALTGFINAVYAYLPNVLGAILIFLVAGAVATAGSALVLRLMGGSPLGKLVATAVPSITMLLAVFMILNQLQIAPAIVTITYAALIGSVALGMALAFGLGGREVAAELLSQAVSQGKEKLQEQSRERGRR